MKMRQRKISKKAILVLVSVASLSVTVSVSAFEWWIASSFCTNGGSQSQSQINSCDTPNETTVGAAYGSASSLKKGKTHNFVFSNNLSPIGTTMKRHCFTTQTGCTQIIAFDANPPGNYLACVSLENCLPSPIVIDVDGDGIKLGAAGVRVEFDIDADGEGEMIQWLRQSGDEALLAIDLNGNGIVDDGAELFGNAMNIVRSGEKATTGFQALAQYDRRALGGNRDFKITRKDEVWLSLLLWSDTNADGVSTMSEIVPISTTKIRSLGTVPKHKDIFDESGNWLPLWAKAKVKQGKNVDMVDVFFAM